MDFIINIHKEKDGTYAATCHSIPGKVGRGNSRIEAITNMKILLRAYIEYAPAPPTAPYTVNPRSIHSIQN